MIFSDGDSSMGEHDMEFIATDRTSEARGSNESGEGFGIEATRDGNGGGK
jgi:hypothetical protein